MAADAAMMRDIAPLKRIALLACVVHVARTRARDDLAEMFCKRMAQVTKLAKAELAEIREHQAEMSDRLITNYRSVLGCLDPRNSEAADAGAAGRLARRTVADAGGFEAQLADIEAVAAHHANNYMPLVAKHRRRDRALRYDGGPCLRSAHYQADRSPRHQSQPGLPTSPRPTAASRSSIRRSKSRCSGSNASTPSTSSARAPARSPRTSTRTGCSNATATAPRDKPHTRCVRPPWRDHHVHPTECPVNRVRRALRFGPAYGRAAGQRRRSSGRSRWR
jgi:hypothetical protein